MKHELPPLPTNSFGDPLPKYSDTQMTAYAEQVAFPLQKRIAELEAQLASGQYPVGRIESVDGGPNRHGVVVWLAHQGAPIKPGDKLYTHPAPTQQPPSEAQIDAAARALNRQAARECGINERDYWNLHADEFLADAKAALEAAHHIGEKK